jgi:hypothetical protein
MPAAIPMPVPATLAATRTASPTGSGPLDWRARAALGCELRERGGAEGLVARFAPPARDPDARLVAERFAAGLLALERLSLRRPGRERGRLPITPGSSATRQSITEAWRFRARHVPKSVVLRVKAGTRGYTVALGTGARA